MGLTLSTNVLSFSGISRGMVVRTSMIADRGMLTLGLEAWEARGRGSERVTQGLLRPSLPSYLSKVRAAQSFSDLHFPQMATLRGLLGNKGTSPCSYRTSHSQLELTSESPTSEP